MTNEDTKYNGWTNYETWCVNLWIDNDEGTQEMVREQVAEVVENAEPGEYTWQTAEACAVRELSECAKEWHEDRMNEERVTVTGVFADLLGASLTVDSKVDCGTTFHLHLPRPTTDAAGEEHTE